MSKKTTKAHTARRASKPRNPNILSEILRPQRGGSRAVRALARLFDNDDPHTRRALFRWACVFTGVPERMAEPIHAHLFHEAAAAAQRSIR